MINNKQNNPKCWKWLLIGIVGLLVLLCVLLGIPYLLNHFIQQPQQFSIVGDGKDWLMFWATWLSATATFAMIGVTLYVLRKQLHQNHEENNSSRKLQLKILEYQQELEWFNKLKLALIEYSKALNYNEISRILDLSLESPYSSDNINVVLDKIQKLYDSVNTARLHLNLSFYSDSESSNEFFDVVNNMEKEIDALKHFFSFRKFPEPIEQQKIKSLQVLHPNILKNAIQKLVEKEQIRIDNILPKTDNEYDTK